MNETLKRALSGFIYIIIMCLGTCYSKTTFSLLFAIIGSISIYEMWKLRVGKNKIIALLYVIIPFVLIQFLKMTNSNDYIYIFDPSFILFILILTWTFDTFAYLIGKKFGKHRIAPSISPKKSWEGFIGGYFFTMVSSYIIVVYFLQINLLLAFIITIILPFTATLGDFIESYYKRVAGVKDSGNFIPGHGGMLDRIDAFLITIPISYIIISFIK